MSFMSRLKGVFDVKTGQKGQNLRKNAPKTAKFTSKKGVIIIAIQMKRQNPPSSFYDYEPPTSLSCGQIAVDVVGNIYTGNGSNVVTKQLSSVANHEVGNPNLLHNGSLSVNQRGQTSYLQSWGYSIDGWVLIGNFNANTKTLTFDASNNIARFGLDAISYMRQAIVDIDSKDLGDYTLSAKVDGVIYSQRIPVGNSVSSSAYNMGSFYFIYEKFAGVSTWWFGIGVVPGTTSPGSVTIEWVKLEKGAQATNYTPKSYLDELTACQRYFVKIATWQMLGNGYVDWEGKNAYIQIPTASTMRVDPTCSTISGAFYCGDGTTFSVTNVAPSATVRPGWVVLHFTGTFGHANQTCCFITSDTQTTLSAEI